MKLFINESSRKDHRTDGARRDVPRFGPRVLTVAAVATIIVGLGVLPVPSRPATAGDEGRADSSPSRPSRQDFVREVQRTLKEQDNRLIVLTKQVLEEPDSPGSLEEQFINIRARVKSAEEDHLRAKLAREVTEIAVKEYKEGVFPRDLAAADDEIRLAKSEVERSRRRADEKKKLMDEIVELVPPRSASDLVAMFDFGDRYVSAMLAANRSKFDLDQAQAVKDVLVKYTKEKRVKDLEAEVKKAHSDELAKQATWEIEKVKLDRLQKAMKEPWPASDIGQRLLALLDRAMPIDEQAQNKLDQLAKATDSGEELQKEIRGLTNQLGAIIEEAEAARAASELHRLGSRLRRATRR